MKNRRFSSSLFTPLTLFAISGILGVAAAYDWRLSLPWLAGLFAGIAAYAVIVTILRQRPALIAVIVTLWGVAYSLLLGFQYRHLNFGEAFAPATWLGNLTSMPFPDLVPIFIDANAAASFIAPTIPLAIGLALRARGLERILWSVSALIAAYGLLLTSSRGAFVALAAALALWLLLRWQGSIGLSSPSIAIPGRNRLIMTAIIVAILVGGIIFLATHPDGRRMVDSTVSRAADRLIVYRNSLFLALDFPFTGIGPGEVYGQMYSRFQLLILPTFIGYAHNLLLGIWLAQGLLGITAFLWLMIVSFRRVIPGLTLRGPLEQSAAIGGAALLIHGLTDAPQYDNAWPTMLLAFALLGLIVVTSPLPEPQQTIPPKRPRWRLAVAGVVVLALILAGPQIAALGMVNYAAQLQARAALAPGLTQQERARLLREAGGWADYSLQIAPNSALALKRIGSLQLELGDYPRAVETLERAYLALPSDQATQKALGLAYVWNGAPERGADLFVHLDYASEMREELDVWPQAWRDRGRADLAGYALEAARVMDNSR